MSQARNQLLASHAHINTLRLIVGVALVVIAAQWWRVGQLQETRRLFIPPDLSRGVLTQPGEVPAPVIYTFAYYIYQQLHRWKTDGETDYPRQIFRLQGFLTPDCINALGADMNHKKRQGELKSRVRTLQEIPGRGYAPQRVVQTAPGTWQLWLDVLIRETIDGHPVKAVNLRYPLRVVRFDVDREVNPWGLAIACDTETQPIRLTPDDLSTAFEPQKNEQEGP